MSEAPLSAGQRRLLVVEDDPDAGQLVAAAAEAEGFVVTVCPEPERAVALAVQEGWQAVLLDWTLPGGSGLEVCRRIRAAAKVLPILFLSGRGDEASITRALEAGADDFVVKPARPSELMARVAAQVRKAAAISRAAPTRRPPADSAPVLRAGDVGLDPRSRRVFVGEREISLGSLEYLLLERLLEDPGHAVSEEQILRDVYGYTAEIATDRVPLLVRRLRVKLGPGPRRAAQIVAIPGFGYRLDPAAA